eukprot:Nk52_evm4s281 gene=Nk52_evmTU4s281
MPQRLRIRLQRLGQRHLPFYRIVVAQSTTKRDGKFLERIGTYDPLASKDGTKHVSLKFDRVLHWLSCGAEPSDTVMRLFGQSGLTPPSPHAAAGMFKENPYIYSKLGQQVMEKKEGKVKGPDAEAVSESVEKGALNVAAIKPYFESNVDHVKEYLEHATREDLKKFKRHHGM